MNLAVDFGNTRIKAAVFDGSNLVSSQVFGSSADFTNALAQFKTVKNCIVGSVTGAHKELLSVLEENFSLMVFLTSSPIPIKNHYQSIQTLGSDRLAAAVGGYAHYPNQNVLTIDAGTCIKYNFVSEANAYLGGAISPGLAMRLKAMHNYTFALPQVELKPDYTRLIGQSTTESLLSGAMLGAAAEIDGTIQRYQALYPNLTVLLTGGDADFLAKQVKSRFFASQNLLLTGLNAILNYNLEH